MRFGDLVADSVSGARKPGVPTPGAVEAHVDSEWLIALSLVAIAKAHGRCHKHLAKLIERSFVAPDDLVAIFAVK